MGKQCCKNIKMNNFFIYSDQNLEIYLKHKRFCVKEDKSGYKKISNIENVKFNITDKMTAIYQIINYGSFTTKSWQILLQNNPSDYFYNNYIRDKKISGTHFCHDTNIHRGHYIGSQLAKFLIPKNILYNEKVRNNDINLFFGKGNPINIYYQTRTANCNSNTANGQLYFEKDIIEFLSAKNSDGKTFEGRKIFYEIEDIFFDEKSIGRKLTIKKCENNIQKECESHHVFIPNI
ncbi:hypothetical protein KG089_02180 [Carnobacteriaceae bacterium zg-ZUI252]|nr:hypothetical protein [Carnobacteriaceae bacterium zg-ZUI252]MBS4770606.1 hypothetical protein [Carnobacteriaceae bacterium zg-ZUI240]